MEKFLSRTVFTSQEDYIRNFRIRVPADFNFAYDVVDAYAAEEPDKKALLWTDDRGGEIQFTNFEENLVSQIRLSIYLFIIFQKFIFFSPICQPPLFADPADIIVCMLL